MALTPLQIAGQYLYYEYDNHAAFDSAIQYLGGGKYGIDPEEVKTLFDAATAKGEAPFETQSGENFMIKYDYSSRAYTLEKR